MKDTFKTKEIILFLALFIIVFQSVLQNYIPFFSYFDEFMATSVFVLAIFFQKKSVMAIIKREDYPFLLCILIYILLGTFSSAIYQYQSSKSTILALFLAVKWFLAYYGFKYFFQYTDLPPINQLNLGTIEKVTYLMVAYEIVALLNFPGVYGFSAWDLCAKSVFMLSIFMCNFKKKKSVYFCVLLLWFLIFSSGASKGYGAIVLSLIIFFWIIWRKRNMSIKRIVILGGALVAVSWNEIYYYFIQGQERGYARSLLFSTSFKIANDYFPLGSGWGTFCSYIAAKNYSPIYYIYGLSEHRELGVDHQLFLMDAYWPAVIAETGWIGFASIVGVFIILFIKIQKLYDIDVNLYAAGMFSLLYMGITTVEETGFMQPVLICLGILMAGIIGTAQKEKKMAEKK